MIFRFICTRSGRACMHQGVLLAALKSKRSMLARLQAASIDELELWLDRALDADSLAGVFAQ